MNTDALKFYEADTIDLAIESFSDRRILDVLLTTSTQVSGLNEFTRSSMEMKELRFRHVPPEHDPDAWMGWIENPRLVNNSSGIIELRGDIVFESPAVAKEVVGYGEFGVSIGIITTQFGPFSRELSITPNPVCEECRIDTGIHNFETNHEETNTKVVTMNETEKIDSKEILDRVQELTSEKEKTMAEMEIKDNTIESMTVKIKELEDIKISTETKITELETQLKESTTRLDEYSSKFSDMETKPYRDAIAAFEFEDAEKAKIRSDELKSVKLENLKSWRNSLQALEKKTGEKEKYSEVVGTPISTPEIPTPDQDKDRAKRITQWEIEVDQIEKMGDKK